MGYCLNREYILNFGHATNLVCSLLCSLVLLFSPLTSEAALFGEFTLKDEMDMGREFDALVRSSMPLVEDPEVKNYVQGIVDSIVKTLPPQPYAFRTSVLLEPSLNAFATPGGFVFVHTGLIQNLEHESELAGVLAHEIAHVTQRHIARRMERGQVISLATLAAAIAGLAAGGGGQTGGAAMIAAGAAGSAAMLNYSRTDESDADRFGLRYLTEAGYDPSGLSGAFRKIQEQSWGRAGSIPTYLSTHPGITERLSMLEAHQKGLPARKVKNDDSRFQRVRTLIWARYGDMQHAEQVFLSMKSSDPLRFLGLGILNARRNRVADAQKAFDEALRLAPRDELVLREAGTFQYLMGDAVQARKLLEAALKIAPDDYMGLFFYARLLDDTGQAKRAAQMYEKVLTFVPEDAEVHTYYGRSLGKNNQQFSGFLHLAYAALYSNDARRVDGWLEKARPLALSDAEKKRLADFEEQLNARKKLWKK